MNQPNLELEVLPKIWDLTFEFDLSLFITLKFFIETL